MKAENLGFGRLYILLYEYKRKTRQKTEYNTKRSIVQPPKLFRPRNDPQPWNDPQIDPEMIPISLHVDPEMIPI